MPEEAPAAFIASPGGEEEVFTVEQLLCCLITGPVIAQFKCTLHNYFKVAAWLKPIITSDFIHLSSSRLNENTHCTPSPPPREKNPPASHRSSSRRAWETAIHKAAVRVQMMDQGLVPPR